MQNETENLTDGAAVATILAPDSIAIVGASRDESKRGFLAIKHLQENGFEGTIYPVNPNYEGTVRGLPFNRSVTAISNDVDLAFIATPAATVPSVLRDCANANVRGAVIIAAGFSEAGASELETEVKRIAASNSIRLIGPNIQGFANTHRGIDLLGGYTMPKGRLALLTQSGNVGVALGEKAGNDGAVGFSYNIGIGNETDLKFHEYFPALQRDANTDAIVLYVEGLSEGRAFIQAAKDAIAETPILVLKGGESDVGKLSVSSHTSSLAGDSDVIEDVFKQAGIIKVERTDELLPVAETLSTLPIASGPNIGILSDGGGHATLTADRLRRCGLSVPELSEETKNRLRERVPNSPNIKNPVDIMGQGGDLFGFSDCADIVLSDEHIDALIVTGAFGGYNTYTYLEDAEEEPAVARELSTLPEKYGKPLLVHSYYTDSGSDTIDVLREANIPVNESLEVVTTCIEQSVAYGTYVENGPNTSDFVLPEDPTPCAGIASALSEGSSLLSEYDATRILETQGLPVVPSVLTRSPAAAVDAAAGFATPVAMKIVSPDIVHKTDVGGVVLDVDGPAAVREAYRTILDRVEKANPTAACEGVAVSPMAASGVETIVGVLNDDEVGPVIMFGLVGTLVEILGDTAFKALPLTEHDARELIDDIDASGLLYGVRNTDPVDRESLIDLLLTVSEFAVRHPQVEELDLNPVVLTEDGATIVDASLRLAETDPDTR